jgi:predicted alpha/beta-fold hydrolase
VAFIECVHNDTYLTNASYKQFLKKMLTETNAFEPPRWLVGGHLQTIWPSFFRKVLLTQVPSSNWLPTPDGDELAYDYYPLEASKGLVVVCHGLEGHARRPYILGMVAALLQAGYEVLAWSYRGCGTRLNKKPIFYHSGATYDLQTVVDFAQKLRSQPLFLVGFSLGGNLVMRWLGEQGERLPAAVSGAVAISVPLDLAAGSDYLTRPAAKPYTLNFLKSLKAKVAAKAALFPTFFQLDLLAKTNNLRQFDEFFTAPLHGFKDANDYYAKASSLFVLNDIAVPTLLLQAANDPFLPPSCYPKGPFRKLKLEVTASGGHVGFTVKGKAYSYAEQRVVDFLNALCITCSNPSP